MSWFKKIFSKMTMDDIEEEVISRKKKEITHQSIKTRMTYQYPKGQFRFPLIQDQPKTDRQQTDQTRNKQERHNQPAQGKHNQQRQSNERTMEKKETVSRKVEPKNRTPFRPANIPSPIYGFKRPAPKEDLEYELQDSFLQGEKPKETIQEFDAVPEETMEEYKEPVLLGTDNINKTEQVPEEKTVASEPVMDEEKDEPELVVEVETVEPEEPVLDEEILDPELVTEEEIVDPEPAMDEEIIDLDHVTNEEILNQDPIINEQIVESDTQINEEMDNSDLVNEEKMNRDHEKSGDEHPEDGLGYVSTEKVHDDTARQHKEKSRSNMPFNVLMLKQDRKKWEKQQNQKQQRKELEEAKIQTASALQEPGISEGIYHFPSLQLLHPPVVKSADNAWLDEQTELLDETLLNFNVNARVVNVSQGPSVTRFEVQPDPGVKVSKITNLSDDIKLSMAAKDIRIEAPIPGKRSIGIELPNHDSRPVQISEIIASDTFSRTESPLTAVLGLDISGAPVVTDLRKMPHGLIAGATGSGKSVCINSILVSLLYKAKPDELKLLLIDPKMVELAPYNHIPHLVSPVITDVKAATAALKWAVDEMERRYELFAHASVRDIGRFNELAVEKGRYSDKLPYMVVVIDELADLMMMSPADVEESICRIAQKARACGIHLLIATQRPSVDVITGLIKANVPTRIAFSVSSQVDSRTIIDISGAEKLLGRGDMLFLDSGSSKPVRIQGTFVSDHEIDRIIEHVRSQGKPTYLFEQEELLKKAQIQEDEDELFMESCEFVVSQGSASTSLLQRHFRVGYNRAARLILMMEQRGIVSEARGSKARDVLINESELSELKESLVQ
ncbi:DNA translocase FtsK [Lederbergia citrea]|uniref:DNA translocase FtsK n=1 Tax=Lederbergia citrea TaxID=2833581 RepID=UPI001BC8D821|nr:DNA translocase FtsK [Lederbergia citrea]MBS4175995.1 DNA translocase FtsK [Lederbergia citrea]